MSTTRNFTAGMIVASCKAATGLWQSGVGGFGQRHTKFPIGTMVMFVRYAGCLPFERDNPPISVVFHDGTLWFALSESLKPYEHPTSSSSPWQDLPGILDTGR